MEFGLLKKIVDEVKGHTKDSYLHMQGEPLLHPDLIKCINYVADADIRTSFATNCMALDSDMADKILDSKLDEIILSIDSLNKKRYEQIRVGGDFEKVFGNIERFLEKKRRGNKRVSAVVCLTKMRENEDDWGSFCIGGSDQTWTKGYSTFAGAVIKNESVTSMKPNCAKQRTHMTVLWNGDVVKCCRDYDGISKYGNLYKQSVGEVWNGFRETDVYKIPLCEKC
jgi:MoaA/NifB/PqqE/SkfB family radical SAM enzyme